jgi:hypothetical protein
MNIGITVWTNPEPEDDQDWIFGYCEIEGEWQLASLDRNVSRATPLLKAPRTVRVRSMKYIPGLLDLLKDEVTALLDSIDTAEIAISTL